MPYQPKILAFAGSARRESFNRKLVQIAAQGATEAGAEVRCIDLSEFELQLFDQDWEARHGLPEGVLRLKAALKDCDGFLVSSPEYNSSLTAFLKNAIDWASRPAPGEARLACFAGKCALILSASPGALGGLRGLVHLRAILSNLGVLVLPEQKCLSGADQAFTDEGQLKDQAQQQGVKALGGQLARTCAKLRG